MIAASEMTILRQLHSSAGRILRRAHAGTRTSGALLSLIRREIVLAIRAAVKRSQLAASYTAPFRLVELICAVPIRTELEFAFLLFLVVSYWVTG